LLVSVTGTPTAIPDSRPPDRFALYQNIPNPFNPTTVIRFDTAREGNVELRIYDGSGKLIRTLVDRHLPATNHEVTWDGRDDGGAAVASGVYFYRLVADGQRATKKMTFLK
jgi:flagellar hook assembly protein FlgD